MTYTVNFRKPHPHSHFPSAPTLSQSGPRKVLIKKGDNNKYSGYNFIGQVPSVQNLAIPHVWLSPFCSPNPRPRGGEQGTRMKVLFSNMGALGHVAQLCCGA